MPSGSGGQIAITRAGSLYHTLGSADAATWNWTNFVSESLEHTLEELEEGSISGNKDAPPSHKGIDFSIGAITIEPNPDAVGHFMRGVFGQSSGTVLCQAGSTGANSQAYGAGVPAVRHRFVPIQASVSEQNFLPPYHLMVYKDVGSAFFYEGSQLHELELTIQAGQLVKASVTQMARNVTRYARSSSVSNLVVPKSRPWLWDMASIQVGSNEAGLASNTNFESITLNLTIPMEGVVLLNGTKKYAEYQVNEFRRVAASGTLSFRNQDEYDAFIAYENRFLRINLANTNSAMVIGNPASAFFPSLQINIPQFKFLSYSVPIGGPNRLQSQFTGKGERDVTSNYMIDAVLTNVTSAY